MLALDDVESADAGADVDSEAVTIGFVDDEAGVGHGLGRGGEGEMDEAAHFTGLFFVDEKERVEVLDLGSEADGVAGEVEGFNFGHTAFAGEQAGPDLWGCLSYTAEEPNAGDDDAPPNVLFRELRGRRFRGLLFRILLGHCYLAAF